jgi:hypothetical protein
MSVGEQLSEILSRWQSEDVRRRDGSLPVWDIGRPGLFARHRRRRQEVVAACRRELLTTLLRSDAVIYLMHHEPPREYDVPGSWQPAGTATWLVPPGFDLGDPVVMHWLALGDWRFYSAPGPAEGGPDVFRSSAAGLMAWMSGKRVRALIESFHDDTEWVVALATA